MGKNSHPFCLNNTVIITTFSCFFASSYSLEKKKNDSYKQARNSWMQKTEIPATRKYLDFFPQFFPLF